MQRVAKGEEYWFLEVEENACILPNLHNYFGFFTILRCCCYLPSPELGVELLPVEPGVVLFKLPEPLTELEPDGLEPLEEEPVPASELAPALESVPLGVTLEPEGLALPLVPEELSVDPAGVVILGEFPVSTLPEVLGADVSGDGVEAGLPSFLFLSQADNPKPKAAANNVGNKSFFESVRVFISNSFQ